MARKKKPKPQTEIDLERLQELYLKDRTNKEVLDEYFLLLKVYARSLALKEIGRKKIFLPPDRVDEVATEAALLLLNQYRNEEWTVRSSFAGTLRWKVVEALYRDAEEDKALSLNLSVGESGTQELGDMINSIGGEALWGNDYYDPQEELIKGIDFIGMEIYNLLEEVKEVLSYRLYFLFLIYLLLHLRRPKTRLTLPTFRKIYLSKKEEEAFDILLLEIRNRIDSHIMRLRTE